MQKLLKKNFVVVVVIIHLLTHFEAIETNGFRVKESWFSHLPAVRNLEHVA